MMPPLLHESIHGNSDRHVSSLSHSASSYVPDRDCALLYYYSGDVLEQPPRAPAGFISTEPFAPISLEDADNKDWNEV